MTIRRPVLIGTAAAAIFLATASTALATPAPAGPVATRAVTSTPTAPGSLPTALPLAGVGTPTATNAFGPSDLSPNSVITCTVNVQNPHNSSHVHGTVNTISTIACTGAMSELAQYVGLYYNNVLVGEKSYSNSGVASLTGNFATPCKSGTYVGASSWLEVAPPGYYPPSDSGVAYSNVVTITC